MHRSAPKQMGAIFEEIHRVNQVADQDEGVLRISLDTKATVRAEPFSRDDYPVFRN